MKKAIAAFGLYASVAASQTSPTPANSPSIVFVCEHGAAKSVIATAYFNKLAAERRASVSSDIPRYDASGGAVRRYAGRITRRRHPGAGG
jgi:hypothetical protein